ncbi:MAG: hypothetical protein HY017_24940 [Betaproteobacteria bacterium]|nr:hypothetical protein [Betaproteobacteria bacterium]
MKTALAILGFMALAAHGAEPPSAKTCATIKENPKRLACFDAASKADLSAPKPPPPPAATTLVPLEVKELRLGMNRDEVEAIIPGFSRTCGGIRELKDVSCTHTIPIVPSDIDVITQKILDGGRGIKGAMMEADRKEKLEVANRYPKLTTFADAPVKSFTVRKRNDVVASVSVTLDTTSWIVVTQALLAKYGKPFSSVNGTVQNRAGANFDQEKMTWRNGDQYVVAEKRTTQLDTMRIALQSDKGDAEDGEAVKDIGKKRAKDL